MLKPFRTLRLRLTLLYVVIFGVLQAALWIAIDSTRASLVYRRLDTVLAERAQGILQSITTIETQSGPSRDRADLEPIVRSLESPDVYLQIRDPEGNLLASSSNAAGVMLPFDARSRAARPTGSPEFLSFNGNLSQRLGLPGRRIREVTLYGGPPGQEFYLQLASSMGPIDRELTNIRDLLIIFAFVSLVVAAITSWYMARRSLAPLLAIARQAREISARRLDQRIPVPATGDEVAEMIIVLNDMLDRLEAEFAAQRRFIADVTHELKTPLAVLLGETQAMQRQGDSGDHAAYVATVHEETRRILRLVEAFLILNRLQAGAPAPSLDRISMEEVGLSAIRKCRNAAKTRDVRLLPSLPSGGDTAEPVVIGDSDMLVSALQNLIENAIAASPAGGAVEVVVEVSGEEVVTTVRDQGPGLTEDRLAQLFRLFDEPAQKHAGKPGIGLTIARAAAELHRGSLRGRTRTEGGFEFTIHLPLARESDNHHRRS